MALISCTAWVKTDPTLVLRPAFILQTFEWGFPIIVDSDSGFSVEQCVTDVEQDPFQMSILSFVFRRGLKASSHPFPEAMWSKDFKTFDFLYL